MRWKCSQLLWAAVLAGTLPHGLFAQPVPVDPYRAASPYNPIVMGRTVPSPANNFVSFVLCCEFPNQNLAPYVAPECGLKERHGCGKGCGNSCDAIFSRAKFGHGRCHGGCENDCDSGNSCGAILTRPKFGHGRCHGKCDNDCGSPCAAPVPVAPSVKAVSAVEPIAFWHKSPSPANSCESCPPNGPPPKHTLKTATSLGCAGCSSLESEAVFIFGSCRQFFGEPTHQWLHGK